MKDLHVICDKFQGLKTFNQQLKDFANLGWQPIKLFEVRKEDYDICILLGK